MHMSYPFSFHKTMSLFPIFAFTDSAALTFLGSLHVHTPESFSGVYT